MRNERRRGRIDESKQRKVMAEMAKRERDDHSVVCSGVVDPRKSSTMAVS